jgi:hypothetical protein
MNDHEWFRERIAAHLAGGLNDEERVAFDAHRAACPDCAREFEAIEQTEKKMTQLFAAIAPGTNFEDQLLGRLRLSAPLLRINPLVRRAAIAAAAAIVLGGFGYVANRQMEHGGLQIARVKSASNLRQIGQAILLYANEHRGVEPRQNDNRGLGRADEWFLGRSATTFGDYDSDKSEPTDREKVSYGDRQVEFRTTPFAGVERDMTVARERFQQIASDSNRRGPFNADDSVLVPADVDGNGVANGPVAEAQRELQEESARQPASPMVKTGQVGLALSGDNRYAGGTVVNSTTPQLRPSGVATGSVVAGKEARGEVPGQTSPGANFYFDTSKSDEKDHHFQPVADLEETKKSASEADGVRQQLEVAGRTESKAPVAGATEAYGVALANDDKPADLTGKQKQAGESNQPDTRSKPGEMTPDEVRAQVEREQHGATTQAIQRKVIRNGDIEFEVDSFDSTTLTVTKIVVEEGGYIATTNSEKLPNGKVKGVIVVRVPPDHLDTLVMKLRALGDLKRQNLTAQDVTKQYTDTASELRAARAMEDRLLNIIKNSQGQIKDLLAAEKELAVWREKIEKTEGELRYYDNLVALSTLNISLFERDIRTPDTAKETENVDMGVETDDVDAQRLAAIKAIDDAKGRIVESELKKLDAGQLAAKIVADIPADSAGPAIDRLKQLGKIARLEVHRAQTTKEGQPAKPGTKLERGDTHIVLSLYNLANVAPRQTSNLNLAAADVEQAYNAIVERVVKSDGRIVTSNLNRQTDQQTSGVIQFEVKSADAEATLADIRKIGEVTRLSVAENPDTNNVTSAKRGFNITIVSMASMLPREVNNRSIASSDVDKSYQTLQENLRKASARIIVSRIEDQGKGQHNAYVDFEIARAQIDAIEKALASVGETYNRSVNAAADAENVTDSKVQFKLAISPASALPARETDALAIEVKDVDAAAQSFLGSATSSGGHVIDSNFSKDQRGQTARVIVEVPYSATSQIVAQTKQLGTVRGSQQATNQQAPSGEFARARIELTLASGEMLVAPEHGVLATLRNGLSTSFAGLMWSLQLIVIGLCLVGPWVLLIWGGVKVLKRSRRRAGAVTT